MPLPTPPSSWSSLTWDQLTAMWDIKLHSASPDIARVQAFLHLLGLTPAAHQTPTTDKRSHSPHTGERIYTLEDSDGVAYNTTARQLAHLAQTLIPWFDYPYGDPGQQEQRDEKGNIIQEQRTARPGYVSPMKDAFILPITEIAVTATKVIPLYTPQTEIKIRPALMKRQHVFSLPQVACNNITWQQYRTLQALIPQIFDAASTNGDSQDSAHVRELQAQFIANILTPRSLAIFDNAGTALKVRPHYDFTYSPERAEELVSFWLKRLNAEQKHVARHHRNNQDANNSMPVTILFHILFQTLQTAVAYYAETYPDLFSSGGSKTDGAQRDALAGEVATINAVMKYAGYAEPQTVYDSNLPFVLDILNTMTKEAKAIEKINAKSRHKS